jgi:hypothetical protein
MVRDIFTNKIHAHTVQLHKCAETHEVALGLKVRGGGRGVRPRGSGVAPGRVHGVRGLVQDVLMFLGHGRAALQVQGRIHRSARGRSRVRRAFLGRLGIPAGALELGHGATAEQGALQELPSRRVIVYGFSLALDATEPCG